MMHRVVHQVYGVVSPDSVIICVMNLVTESCRTKSLPITQVWEGRRDGVKRL